MASVETSGLTKIFAGRKVVRDVDLKVRAGAIHALLGANGSGKSTLVKLLTGVYRPDGGTIAVGGRQLPSIASPHAAGALGIAVVHQEAPLIETFSIAECIAQFRGYPTRAGRIQWGRLHREVRGMLERFDLALDPAMLAGRLSAAERALVAVIIALDRVGSDLRLLILDEVTASLPRNQAEPYLDRIAALARLGVAVLMVTHRLAELDGRAARATVLRDGAVAYEAEADGIDERRLIDEMVGPASPGAARSAAPSEPGLLRRLWAGRDAARRRDGAAGVALAATSLRGAGLRDLSFEVRAGEIVGMAGLSQGGVAVLPKMLAGLQAIESGRLTVGGRDLPRPWTPRALIRAGMAVLPADRLRAGGIASLTVAENILLPDLGRFWMRPRREADLVGKVVAAFDIRPALPQSLFGKLSGGNQQKTILGKWLALRPTVLVLDDPTNGVDPAARETIFARLREAAAEGIGILAFSTEPEQLAAFCSRVMILKDGTIAHELAGAALDRRTISRWCYA